MKRVWGIIWGVVGTILMIPIVLIAVTAFTIGFFVWFVNRKIRE